MSQNILLLLTPDDTSFHFEGKNIPPLAIGEIQGYLRENGFNVITHDLNYQLCQSVRHRKNGSLGKWRQIFEKEFVFRNLLSADATELDELFGELLTDIDFANIDCIGISVGGNFSFFEIHSAFLLGKLLKEKYKIPLVFGGTNITYLYQFKDIYAELWQAIFKNFKYVFIGPGEKSFEKLILALNNGTADSNYYELKGAIYFKDDVLTSNFEDLPALACPDFTGLNLEFYRTCIHATDQKTNETHFYKWPYPYYIMASDLNRNRVNGTPTEEVVFLPYIFNYHCPYNCAFCEESFDKKRIPCSKNVEVVVNDIKNLIEKYNTQYFYFFNNTFNYNKLFVRRFCNMVIEQKLEFYWNDCARVNGLNKELLELMYKAGCRKLIFGFETASPKLLKYIDKRLDLEQLKKVLTWCKEIGIWCDLETIIGFPYEYEEDFQETCRFIAQNKDLINCFQLNKYFVVPSSLMGTYPDRYKIKLKTIQSYDKLLEKNKQLSETHLFSPEREIGDTNFHIYSFDETEGRRYYEIVTETRDKIERISKLLFRLPVFSEAISQLSSHKIIAQMLKASAN